MRRFVSLFLLIVFLAGCSSTPNQPDTTPAPANSTPEQATSGPNSEGDKVTISYAAWDYERQIYEPLVKKFNEENPNITVVLVPLDDLMNISGPNPDYSPFAQLRRVVSGADTAPASIASPETLNSSLILDLTPQMDADSSFKRDDFYPGALEQYTINGATRVLPRYLYIQLLNYNKALFKGAGLPEPKLGWSWNDLLGAAQQLAKKNGSKVDTYGYFDPTTGILPMMSLLQKQGINLFNAPPGSIKLDQPEIVDAVTRLQSLVESGALLRPTYSQPAANGGPISQQNDPAQLVRDGKLGIWPSDVLNNGPVAVDTGGQGSSSTQSSPTADLNFEVGTITYPPSTLNFYTNVDGYLISAGTEHPAEAWKWIEFLSRQQIEQQFVGPVFKQPGRIPARQSLAEQEGVWKDLDPQTVEAYKWALANPTPLLDRSPDYTLLNGLSQAMDQIFSADKKDPKKALQEAQKQVDQQMAEQQLTPTATPNLGPVAVATPEPQVAPEGATTIKFAALGYNSPDLRRLARSFRDQRPDIYVDVRSTDVFTESPTLAQIAKSNDCFAWYSAPQGDDDFKGLLDLQPLFDADASFPQSDYSPAMLGPYQREGKLYGLPYAATIRSLNYNKTAFDAAGIQPPTAQWKPDDFLAAAKALTKGEGDRQQYGYVPLGGPQQDLMFFMNQFGAQLTTGSGKDVRPNFNDPKVVQAIQWYLDLSSTHKVMPPLKFPYQANDNFEDRSYELVQNGRAGMWFDQGYGMFGGPKGPDGQNQTFEIGLAPLPVGTSGLHSGDIYLRGLHISAQTEQSQACWEWLKFLSTDVTNLQGGLPARSSILASDAFKGQASPDLQELAKVYADVLKRAPSAASGGTDPSQLYSMDTYWFFKAIMDALDKKAPLDQGLTEAQKFTTAWLDCMVQKPNKPATCAQQVDPTYKGYNTEDPSAQPNVIGIPRG